MKTSDQEIWHGVIKKLYGLRSNSSSRVISDNRVVQSAGVFPLLKITRRCPAKIMYFLNERTLAEYLDIARFISRRGEKKRKTYRPDQLNGEWSLVAVSTQNFGSSYFLLSMTISQHQTNAHILGL